MNIKEINSKFDANICILPFQIADFPILLAKLNDSWQQIDTEGEDKIKWIVAQSAYEIANENMEVVHHKILYVFGEPTIEDLERILGENNETL